jgi:hypothetical protein
LWKGRIKNGLDDLLLSLVTFLRSVSVE